jgi:hypothetical protein
MGDYEEILSNWWIVVLILLSLAMLRVFFMA